MKELLFATGIFLDCLKGNILLHEVGKAVNYGKCMYSFK